MPADHRGSRHHTAIRPGAVMRGIARITCGERSVQELAKLLGDTDAHADHGATSPKRRNHRIAILQRGAATNGDSFLSFAGESLRRDFPFMLPTDERLLEQPGHEHIAVQLPFDAAFVKSRWN